MPPSMREISATRSSPSTRRTVASRPLRSTTNCVSANAATCGRWVTTRTWRPVESRASKLPHRQRGRSTHTGVDLVEGDDLGVGYACRNPNGEDESAQLATRGDSRYRGGSEAAVGGEEEPNPIRSVGTGRSGIDFHRENGFTKSEVAEVLQGILSELLTSHPPCHRQGLSGGAGS